MWDIYINIHCLYYVLPIISCYFLSNNRRVYKKTDEESTYIVSVENNKYFQWIFGIDNKNYCMWNMYAWTVICHLYEESEPTCICHLCCIASIMTS